MTLADLFTPECVIAEMQSVERFPAIVELVDKLVSTGALPAGKREEALHALLEREEEWTTGIGNGIAIPHGFVSEVDSVVAIFGRSSPGIEFTAIDGAPVHFVVLFVVPMGQHTLHLKTLATIAKHLTHAETRNRLANATDEANIFEVLSREAVAV